MSFLGKWFAFGRDEIFEEGMAAYDRGDFEEAVDAFETCIRESQDASDVRLAKFYLAQAWSELGCERLQAGDPARAAEYFESALDLFPKYPDLNVGIARAYRGLQMPDKALEYLQRALAVNPHYAESIMLQAVVWYECGRQEEGLARANYACQLDGSFSMEPYCRALTAHVDGHPDEAIAHLLTMASRVCADAGIHLRLGDSFMRARSLSEAIAEYRKALDLSPGYAEAHCKLAKAYAESQEFQRATVHFEKALQLNPCYADAHFQLGVAYEQLHRSREARREFEQTLTINPAHPIALQRLNGLRTA